MKQIFDHWHSSLAWMLVPVYHTGELSIYIYIYNQILEKIQLDFHFYTMCPI